MDARGVEMICVDAKNYPEWQGTHVAIRVIPEGSGT
jgi:hypothetical protein